MRSHSEVRRQEKVWILLVEGSREQENRKMENHVSVPYDKVNCRVQFIVGKKVSEPFDAQMHRFIHKYDRMVTFWYGVVDVSASLADVAEIFGDNPSDFYLHVVFEDGMGGRLHCSGGGMAGNYFQVSGMAVSGLSRQPPI